MGGSLLKNHTRAPLSWRKNSESAKLPTDKRPPQTEKRLGRTGPTGKPR